MDKIKLIILREFLTRVRKKSFIVMTFVGPLLMAALMIVPVFLATLENEDEKRIGIIDESGIFENKFKDTKSLIFFSMEQSMEEAKTHLMTSDDYGFIHIPANIIDDPEAATLFSRSQPGINTKSDIERVIRKEIESIKLVNTIEALDLDPSDKAVALKIPETIKTRVELSTIKLGEGAQEEETFAEISMAIGIFSGIIIYFFIFMFGVQVMRGVIEEKTNRIIEVIVSSVKPFQLMMGKIVGIAMVGLTQLLLWIILTSGIVTVYNIATSSDSSSAQTELLTQNINIPQSDVDIQEELQDQNKLMKMLNSLPILQIIISFLIYFLGGYLLYAALFAAVGSAVDNETDTQQFMLPITIPLILSMVMAQFIIQNPEGPAAFWFSMIPLTSPVIMMVRIPFGVPIEELILSIALLIGAFLGATWLAARIYRTGILMYGKKPSYKEIWKWIKYKG
jgi:ABC-2 type transport system permease protein